MPPETSETGTPRLVLRGYRADERELFIALMTDPEVTRHTDGPLPLARAQAIFDGITGDGHPRVIVAWAVIERESGEMAGHAAILRNPGQEPPEIGYLLWPRWWGKGLATEIACAVLDYGHQVLGIDQLIATVDSDHVASRRVCEKAGMRLSRLVEDDAGDYAVYVHAGARKRTGESPTGREHE